MGWLEHYLTAGFICKVWKALPPSKTNYKLLDFVSFLWCVQNGTLDSIVNRFTVDSTVNRSVILYYSAGILGGKRSLEFEHKKWEAVHTRNGWFV